MNLGDLIFEMFGKKLQSELVESWMGRETEAFLWRVLVIVIKTIIKIKLITDILHMMSCVIRIALKTKQYPDLEEWLLVIKSLMFDNISVTKKSDIYICWFCCLSEVYQPSP